MRSNFFDNRIILRHFETSFVQTLQVVVILLLCNAHPYINLLLHSVCSKRQIENFRLRSFVAYRVLYVLRALPVVIILRGGVFFFMTRSPICPDNNNIRIILLPLLPRRYSADCIAIIHEMPHAAVYCYKFVPSRIARTML